MLTGILRIFIGCMFVFSGYFKAVDLESFESLIRMYDIVPDFLAVYPAIVIPYIELITGLLLIAGYKIRAVSFILFCFMGMFSIFISINIWRGNNFDCGCFELSRLGIGISEDLSIKLVIRDVIFMLIFYVFFMAKKNYFSLESLLEKLKLKNI